MRKIIMTIALFAIAIGMVACRGGGCSTCG
jgi:hypothetical protein